MNDIKEVYFIPEDFFNPDGFLDRIRSELTVIEKRIRSEPKEKVKNILNVLFLACNTSNLKEDFKLEALLLIFKTLLFYAQQYRSIETCNNIIEYFKTGEFKEKLFSKKPIKSKLVYAEALCKYYILIKQNPYNYSRENIEFLIKAKSYLWKLYIHHIDKKNLLKNEELHDCLTFLALSLAELFRWFEPLYYLNVAESQLPNNTNIVYLRASILERIKINTCMNLNEQLLLKIIDSCVEGKKLKSILKEQKASLNELEKNSRSFLRNKNIPIKTLRTHKKGVIKSYSQYSAYKTFCIDNQLYLNEHSFFCNCGLATKDDLSFITDHQHTKIGWVEDFNKTIDLLVFDYALARKNYYHSLEGVNVSFIISDIKRNSSKIGIKNALLKNSFKSLYSLLDQIAHGIFKVLEIDYESKLKAAYPNENERPKLYFLNMWDFDLFENKHFEENYYLISLYSIAKDLNNSKHSALKEFRVIRNAIEHKIIHILDDSEENSIINNNEIYYRKKELIEKTKILMLLTKSAIFSFVYLVRKKSIYKYEEIKK